MTELGLEAQREEVPGGVSSASHEGFPETGRLGCQMSGLGWPCCTGCSAQQLGSPGVAGGGGGRRA